MENHPDRSMSIFKMTSVCISLIMLAVNNNNNYNYFIFCAFDNICVFRLF